MKRIICTIFALAALGAVKADNVLEIGSVDDMLRCVADYNSGHNQQYYEGLTIKLTADLDFKIDEAHWTTWVPFGTIAVPFNCTFDGQGHTISNLRVDVSFGTDGGVAGLFGQIGKNGVVKDVHIRGGRIDISSNPNNWDCYLGAIAGINEGTIVGCSNTAFVTGSSWTVRIGGIVGKNNSGGRVQNCYNLGDVYGVAKTDNFIGGIVGNNKGYIENCFMRSNVIKNESGTNKTYTYPLYGNNDVVLGNIKGCFYANGLTTHTTQPISIENATSNSQVVSTNNGQTKNILLNGRTLYADGFWNTICLPFAIPGGAVPGYSPIAGAEVMTLDNTTFSAGTLTLNFEPVTSMEAGKPYIVRWKQTINIPNPVFMHATVSDAVTPEVTEYVDYIGSTSPVSISDKDLTKLYLGADNTLYYPSEAMTIQSCRGYFQLKELVLKDDEAAAGVSLVMNFDDMETTFIQSLEARSHEMNEVTAQGWYTLDGCRLAGKPSAKGVYICDGRKVVVK